MPDASIQLLSCLPRLRRYARALMGSKMEADDLVQVTVERGWSRLASWRRGSDMRVWLFSIMHNLHVDQLRPPSVSTEVLDGDTPMPQVNASQANRLEIRDMESALQQLSAEQREVVLLVALEEMTYDEVAASLGVPLGTVMSRLSHGREKLRALMEGGALASPLKVIK
ncbi:MAG TPA: RNA polymerase sigma factor [Burkholderiaceae bacterium]|jgi:RNA polymerase sigma factor (sigma-70 family)|nr:RNA polymerase sigma factor [Burkholderiaceae bacterium]